MRKGVATLALLVQKRFSRILDAHTSEGVEGGRIGDDIKRIHYALVCRSADPIVFNMNGTGFDPSLCKTASGKQPGSSQVTAVAWSDLEDPDTRSGEVPRSLSRYGDQSVASKAGQLSVMPSALAAAE